MFKKLFLEFRDFAVRGNVIDLAVGVVMGSAFTAIVAALAQNIIMPLLSLVTGRINLSKLSFVIPGLFGSDSIKLAYGAFLQAVLTFVVTAFALFLMMKGLRKLQALRKEKEEEEQQSKETKTELLLTEIRDLLREKQA